MKTARKPEIFFPLLVVAQAVLSSCFSFTPYAVLSILPAMVLCLPVSLSAVWALPAAFASGLAVDFLSGGILGLNTLAILPVALLRKGIIRLIIGEDLLARGENFSFEKNGFTQIAYAVIIAQLLFFVIYVAADGAGVRPLWFNAARTAGSLLCSFPLSMLAVSILSSEND